MIFLSAADLPGGGQVWQAGRVETILFRAAESGSGGPPETNVTGVYPPLGIATLAACLREAGHRAGIIDAHALRLSAADVARRIPRHFEGMLLFSTTTLNWQRTLALIRVCRDRAPQAITVVGGPHLDLYPSETASFPEVDYVCIGEGDRAVPLLADALEAKDDPLRIPGLAARRDGEVQFGPEPELTDLDQVPIPAWDLLPWRHYRSLTVIHPFASMVSGRGCPFKCRFCSQRYAGGRFHRMSPGRVVKEWSYLVCDLGAREIIHFDETFTIGEKYLGEVADLVEKERVVIPNSVRARCDTLTPAAAQALARTGTHTVHLGIEAGSDAALARMNKEITVAQVRRATAAVKQAGMMARGYFMLAFPGDTPADYRDTVALARSLRLDLASFTITVLNPGTPIYDDALAAGEIDDYWAAFARGEKVSARPLRPTAGLGDEADLQRLLRRAYLSFYLRAGVLWRLMTNRRFWRWTPTWLRAILVRGH